MFGNCCSEVLSTLKCGIFNFSRMLWFYYYHHLLPDYHHADHMPTATSSECRWEGVQCSAERVCLIVSDSATTWTVACQAPRPWDFSGKNTGVGCHFLLQVIFPNQGSNPHHLHLPHWQGDFYQLHHLRGGSQHLLRFNVPQVPW